MQKRMHREILTECKERTGMWAWKHPHQADGTVTYTELKGDVRFYDMTFGYKEDHMVLHDLTLYAKPGQKLAFVGSTGAGKTTITNLINRFYDVQDGKIRYDDININKIKKADLRRSLGIVLQDTHLFTGTIMENIRYGKLDATDEEVYTGSRAGSCRSDSSECCRKVMRRMLERRRRRTVPGTASASCDRKSCDCRSAGTDPG